MLDLLVFEGSFVLTAYIAAAFLIAGVVKGTLGMGLPAILMVMLTMIMSPLTAIPLITLPMLFSNVVQFARGPSPGQVVKGYWVFALAIVVTLGLTASNITSFPESLLLLSIGVALVLFAVPSLFGVRFPIGPGLIWQVLAGSVAGVLGGLSAVWSPPVVMYTMGRNVDKDDFIGINGFLFMVGSLTLAVALGGIGLLTHDIMVPSIAGLVVSMIGFRLGELIRKRINRDMFRKLILVAFLILGGRLVVISVI
ncbi:MAG: sulfite exporter TauE/SafE family protein [Alphaproteobacteria bacterium]|nr:sulfite exporter TauE/SafE family protein [Alphaproteobacteria bacterium]